MRYRYPEARAADFDAPPEFVQVDAWRIEYLSFSRPENVARSPAVLLAGALQSFQSFREEVEILLAEFPVLIVQLPGQAGSRQIAADLSYDDYAELLRRFLDALALDRVNPVAFSTASWIGWRFAALFPERAARLIVGGIIPEVRRSTRLKMEAGLELLDQGEMDKFSELLSHHLSNPAERDRVGTPPSLLRDLSRYLSNLTHLDALKYSAELRRQHREGGVAGAPECETLVCVGEYDALTTPADNHSAALLCERGKFVIVRGADHLVAVRKSRALIRAMLRFLCGESLENQEGVEYYEAPALYSAERRSGPRYDARLTASLILPDGGRVGVQIDDLSHDGCLLEPVEAGPAIPDARSGYILELKDESLRLEVALMSTRRGLVALFLKTDALALDRMRLLLERLRREQLRQRP